MLEQRACAKVEIFLNPDNINTHVPPFSFFLFPFNTGFQ